MELAYYDKFSLHVHTCVMESIKDVSHAHDDGVHAIAHGPALGLRGIDATFVLKAVKAKKPLSKSSSRSR